MEGRKGEGRAGEGKNDLTHPVANSWLRHCMQRQRCGLAITTAARNVSIGLEGPEFGLVFL